MQGIARPLTSGNRLCSFLGVSAIPDLPRDNDVVTEQYLSIYVSALGRNGFYGAASWYMNHRLNADAENHLSKARHIEATPSEAPTGINK